VPLSHAVCCRPCLPKKLPGSNDTALAVLSLGCHASSNPGSASLRCESAGGSFVSGKCCHLKNHEWSIQLCFSFSRRFEMVPLVESGEGGGGVKAFAMLMI